MEVKNQNLTIAEKLIVLFFDEIYISNTIELHLKDQKMYGSHKTCQVVMIRGLFCSWKQLIY